MKRLKLENSDMQVLEFHTSCSQPLRIGDIAGALELIEFDGKGASNEVTYIYTVSNSGPKAAKVTKIYDDKLGVIPGLPVEVAAGKSTEIRTMAFLGLGTTTNTATVKGKSAEIPGAQCTTGGVSNWVHVEVIPRSPDSSKSGKKRA